MQNSEIEKYLKFINNESKQIKDEIFRLSWYMRGGVTAHELFHVYSFEDRKILNKIVADNVEATKNAKMPLL